jgi:hypothetical protein
MFKIWKSIISQSDVRIVTLPVNAAWQPVFPSFQYRDQTGDFYAYPSRFVVDSVYPDGDVVTHSGKWWDEDGAKRFARSLANGDHPRAVIREVELYWYAPAFGRVDATEEATR